MAEPLTDRASQYRTVIAHGPPFSPHADADAPPWQDRTGWRCRWVAPADAAVRPLVVAYRRRFRVDVARTVRLHVTADERYALYLDGQRIGRGPERGEPDHWFFETYDLPLSAGEHVLSACVWSLGTAAPWAQRTVAHGLLVAPQDEDALPIVGTGIAEWECRRVEGIAFADPSADVGTATGVGPAETIDAATFNWGAELGEGDGWCRAVAGEFGNDGFTLMAFRPAHRLRPATLPPMLDGPLGASRARRSSDDRLPEWQSLLDAGGPVTVPPRTDATMLIDLGTYACFYPRVETTGGAGATVSLTYAEAMHPKDDRDAIDGKTIKGLRDRFLPDGATRRAFTPLWWRCGRYVELAVRTGDFALQIETVELRETRYPLAFVASPQTDSPDLSRVLATSRRTLEMCCHETYMDCPYYEQLMYVGDTRIQCLLTYAHTHDDRPAVKALRMFDRSRLNFNGLPTDAAPGDAKFIPPFAPVWVGMVHDFARHRDDAGVVRSLLPGVRAVLERLLVERDPADGLVRSPQGWNFIDWAAAPFRYGVPPGGETGGRNASLNLFMLDALRRAAELEQYAGEPELAARWNRLAGELKAAIGRSFFDATHNLFRETPDSATFTEHAQVLSILSGAVEADAAVKSCRALLMRNDLTRCSLYFSHYLFDVLHHHGEQAAFYERLRPWYDLVAQGFATTPESFGVTRSDCHAWSAHPLYHVVASIAGIRPADFGYASVTVRPMLGPLRSLDVTTAHPRGTIRAAYRVRGRQAVATIDIDADVTGTFLAGNNVVHLKPGRNTVTFPRDWRD